VIVPDLPGSGHSEPPRGEYRIEGFAADLWRLLDHLGISNAHLVGFSLGGAVALEMAASRPCRVPKLALINSLATYRPHSWRKWMETYVSATLVRMLGMPRAAWLFAARLFPESWQRAMREHAAAALARQLQGQIVIVRGSRHGTPFDSVETTNACLSAFLADQPLPPQTHWVRDNAALTQTLSLAGSIAEEHALSPLLLD
jgi:pimeloyl-ACP methyl ester carboxylesterase